MNPVRQTVVPLILLGDLDVEEWGASCGIALGVEIGVHCWPWEDWIAGIEGIARKFVLHCCWSTSERPQTMREAWFVV